MKADPDYLKKNHMEIRGRNDSLPVIRQLPGEDNGMGQAKFLFPNRYDIYFHDTKAKEVFKTKKRALSHGCIRLADAEKMGVYLLRNTSAWTPEKVRAAMNSGKEQYVKIGRPVAVVITYLTAWVDDMGQLHFSDDIYGHDSRVAPMMFDIKPQPTNVNLSDSSGGAATKKGD
jgi:murein L,D-transpeptidase YcbB/YkuD